MASPQPGVEDEDDKMYDDGDWEDDRVCSFPCEICGETWDWNTDDDTEEDESSE